MTDTVPTMPESAKGAQDWLNAISTQTQSLVENPPPAATITTPVVPQVTTPSPPMATITTPVVPQVTTPVAPQVTTPAPQTQPFYQFSQADRDAILNSLPQDQRVTYEKSLPLVADIAQRMVEHALNNGVAPKLSRYEEAMQAQVTQQDAMFEATLQQRIGNVDALLQDQNFAVYLDTPIAFSGGMTPRKALLQSYDGRNVEGVVDIVNGYKARQAAQVQATPTPPMQQNSMYANPLPAKISPAGQVIAASTIHRAMADFSAGRITREVYGELLKTFEQASHDGRVDNSR